MYWKTVRYTFKAIRCDDHKLLMSSNICEQRMDEQYETVVMGGNVVDIPFHQRPRGIFYTETGSKDAENIIPFRDDPLEFKNASVMGERFSLISSATPPLVWRWKASRK